MSEPYVSTKLGQFDYEIFRQLKVLGLSRVLIACSGGLDSVALVHCLTEIAPKLGIELALAHVHHGVAGDVTQANARNDSLVLVRDLARAKKLEFYSATAPENQLLISEEALRDFRRRELSRMAEEHGFPIVALAHHADDLLETRLMRLIRGTGSQGLLAMEFLDSAGRLRPFLRTSRASIRSYAEQNDLRWFKDPSNQDTKFFRNWIRHEWLPRLEAERAGSLNAFARSLEILAEDISLRASGPAQQNSEKNEFSEGKLDRRAFAEVEVGKKASLLANIAKSFGVRDFSKSKIEEVLKRLHHLESTGQKIAQFSVGGLDWRVDALEIRAHTSQLKID